MDTDMRESWNGIAAWYTDRLNNMPSQFQSSLKIVSHFHTEISPFHTEIILVRIDLDLTRLPMQIKTSLTIPWVKKDSSNFRYAERRETWSSVTTWGTKFVQTNMRTAEGILLPK